MTKLLVMRPWGKEEALAVSSTRPHGKDSTATSGFNLLVSEVFYNPRITEDMQELQSVYNKRLHIDIQYT